MSLENAVCDKVFGSFSENLAFLLSSLKSGQNKHCKSIIFILEEFDLFCHHGSQTLLYNLFDVAQSKQAPICVLGKILNIHINIIKSLEYTYVCINFALCYKLYIWLSYFMQVKPKPNKTIIM